MQRKLCPRTPHAKLKHHLWLRCKLRDVQFLLERSVTVQDTATSKLENEKVERVVSDCDSLVARRPRITFSAKDIQSNVEVLLKEKNAQQHEDVFERPLASSALAAVLAFADVASNAENHGVFSWSSLCSSVRCLLGGSWHQLLSASILCEVEVPS